MPVPRPVPVPVAAPRPVMRPQPVMMPSYPTYGYNYPTYAGGYPYYGAYTNYGYGQDAGSQYGGAQRYSGLANALMPYAGGHYGGQTYGGYGTREIADNPYI